MENKIINAVNVEQVEKVEINKPSDKMTITLKDGYINTNQDADFRKFIEANKGKTFEVDTTHLFKNQYNLKNIPYRILDGHIQRVDNDKRVNINYCGYCGKQWNRLEGEKPCLCDDKYTYFLDDKKENFFINDRAVEILNGVYKLGDIQDQLKEIKYIKYDKHFKNEILINNYSLIGYPELYFYRIKNTRKTINFLYDDVEKVYYIYNGIGYKKRKTLDIPAPIQNKLDKIMIDIFTVAKKGGFKDAK